jgi:hypothetical protein
MLSDQLVITAKLPFVAETTLDNTTVLVRILPLFADRLPAYKAGFSFDRNTFLANDVVDAFQKHVVLYLFEQGETELAQQGKAMLGNK